MRRTIAGVVLVVSSAACARPVRPAAAMRCTELGPPGAAPVQGGTLEDLVGTYGWSGCGLGRIRATGHLAICWSFAPPRTPSGLCLPLARDPDTSELSWAPLRARATHSVGTPPRWRARRTGSMLACATGLTPRQLCSEWSGAQAGRLGAGGQTISAASRSWWTVLAERGKALEATTARGRRECQVLRVDGT